MPTQTLKAPITQKAGSRLLDDLRRFALDLVHPLVADRRLAEQVVFYRQFALLVKSGFPVIQVLRMREAAATGDLKHVLVAALEHAERGGSASEAFARYPETIPPFQAAVIHGGEQGGHLAEALGQIADCLEAEQRLRRFINKQTAYPKVLFVVCQFVIPMFFAFMAGRNPVGAIIGPFVNLVYAIVGFCIVFALCRAVMARSPNAAMVYERVKWALPGFGPIARDFALCRFGRALGPLYSAGVPLQTALRLAGSASGSRQVARAANEMAGYVDHGTSLGEACRATAFFPDRTVDMLATGAESGRVDTMMFRMADYLEQEAEDRAHKAGFIVSQLFYLFVALYVSGLFSLAGSVLTGSPAR